MDQDQNSKAKGQQLKMDQDQNIAKTTEKDADTTGDTIIASNESNDEVLNDKNEMPNKEDQSKDEQTNQDSNDSHRSKSSATGSHLSPEEKDRYAFISEQLNILNSDVPDTPNKKEGSARSKKSGPSKGTFAKILSPFKRIAKGMKRTRRKSPMKAAKKMKFQAKTEPERSDRPLNQSDFENKSDDSSSDEDQWRIFEESDDEIDRKLENKADSFKLSALNVKSIIHKIITDEHVLKMVQNSVDSNEEGSDVDETDQDDGNLTYEPKMTRSKVKDFLQKQGSVPHPWGLSPVKNQDSPSFLDIDLPEDEEDEDFDPEKVPMVDSDEDSESVVSSNVSDLGSPMPSTPRTPCMTPTLSQRMTDTEDSQSLLSPMGPPTQLPKSCSKSMLGRKYQEAVQADEARRNQEEAELIALRTRSKCPMTETSILELEANFVAPDITADMYETQCNDEDWQGFLQSLTKVDTTPEDVVKDAEDDDPEYNYLEEAEQEYDKEDFRDDRAVKIPKKELMALMDELYDAYGDTDPIDLECKSVIKAQTRQIVHHSSKTKQTHSSSISKLTDYEKKQIDDQMRKHVQLLTQMYVLCQNDLPEHTQAGEAAKMLLNELHTFTLRQENAFPNHPTALRACTLDKAVNIVNDPDLFKDKETSDSNEEKIKKAMFKFDNLSLPLLTFPQMEILWNSPVFLFPHLLPHGGLFKSSELKRDRSRVKFLECEDNLLALGLEQFKNFTNGRELIQRLLLPTKSKKQISIRIKNLSAKAAKDNPVKHFRHHKHLPVFPRYVPNFNISMMKAPKDQDFKPELMPSWCKVFLSPSKDPEACCMNSDCIRRRSASLNSLSGYSQCGSAPVTPLGASTDGSQAGSSGSSGKSVDMKLIKRPGRRRLYTQPKKSSAKGSFVPLKGTMLTGAHMAGGRISPITIYVVDRVPVSSTSVTLNQPVFSASSTVTSTVVTCVAPTIVLVNSTSLVQAGKVSTETSTAHCVISPSSVVMSRSTPDLNKQTKNNTGRSRSDGLQSRSTPDLQRKDSGVENNEDNNESPEQQPVIAVSSADMQENINDNVDNQSAPDIRSRSTTDLSLRSTAKSQASTNVVSAKTAENQLSSTAELVPESTTNFKSVTSATILSETKDMSTPDFTRSETPTNENNITVIQGHCTPVLIQSSQPSSCNGTPNSGHKSNSGTPISKSALEIMASYAPYFMSPSTVMNPESRCHCTSERKYRPVIPKLFTQNTGKTVSPFLDKVEKKTNPRRQELQKKARSILPKGFVINSYTSPTKKAASSLIDKAKGMKSPRGRSKRLFSPQKSGTAFRRILPHPVGLSRSLEDVSARSSDADGHEFDDDVDSQKDTASEYDTQESEFMSDDMLESYDNDDDFEAVEDIENFNSNALDEKSADTESDDTQSEDGNETQEDGDSQEENMDVDDDEHLATLMEASTTLRFKPTKVTGGLSSLKAKRHRHKDVTLAMLAPDIIESDPYRDDRDTAFAQAYLLKVKKVLREEMDKYEKFLRIMYEFNKTCQSPVKLHVELSALFEGYPDLLHDFAGFLLPAQAVECGCFLSHQEFVRARTFLRKLEIYFSKTPSQFQKIMKAFSRWYRKPSRKLEDLRTQVEPMLRGQRYLLDEFSLFFPDDKPPESAADDFEEIDFDKSDDETKFDGFEEVELPEEREPLGTKRCQCQCHSTGDDNYRKRKKHCLSCCLTVIDGELVYRINSKTIKKINVTLGPPVKPLPAEKRQAADIVPDTVAASEKDNVQEVEELSDSEAAEKENIENFEESSQRAETARARVANKLRLVSKNKPSKGYQGLKDFYPWKKSTFLQRISNWSRKSKYSNNKTPQLASTSESKLPAEQNSNESTKSQESVNESDVAPKSSCNNVTESVDKPNEEIIEPSVRVEGIEQSGNQESKVGESSIEKETVSVFTHVKELSSSDSLKNCTDVTNRNNTGAGSPEKRPVGSSSDSLIASDILARAFSSAIFGEVSMDSSSVALSISHFSQDKLNPDSSQNKTSDLQEPKATMNVSQGPSFGGGPEGQSHFVMSSDSPFSRIKKSSSSGFLVEASEEPSKTLETNGSGVTKTVVSEGESEVNVRNVSVIAQKDTPETSVSSPFSPFSPFAQEIQTITSVKSPFACIKSPNVKAKRQTTPKFRRITPIPVKGRHFSEDESSSAFQAVAQNSPLIEDSQLKSPFDKSNLEKHSSSESLNRLSVTPIPTDNHTFSPAVKEDNEGTEQSLSQSVIRPGSASNSQRSSETVSQKSVESLQSGSHKLSTSAESGSLKSDLSEQRKSPVVISHPVTHSEDANEGFIKPVISHTDMVHTNSMSENTLLSLGSSLGNEQLHTISNLTNILSALEQPASQSKGELKFSDKDNKCGESEITQAKEVMCKQKGGEVIPGSVTVKENLERVKILDVKVSRLSDSDDSCSKQIYELDKQRKVEQDSSSSQRKTAEAVADLSCDSNSTHSYQLDFSTFSEKGSNESPKRISKRYSGDKLSYLDDTTVVGSLVLEQDSITGVIQLGETKSSLTQGDDPVVKADNGGKSKSKDRKTSQTKNSSEIELITCSGKARKAKSSKLVKSPLKDQRKMGTCGLTSDKLNTDKTTDDIKSNVSDSYAISSTSAIKDLTSSPVSCERTTSRTKVKSESKKNVKLKKSPKKVKDKSKMLTGTKTTSKQRVASASKTKRKTSSMSKKIEEETSDLSKRMVREDNKSRKHEKNTKTVDQNESVPIDTTEKSEPRMPTLSHTGNLNKEGDAVRTLVKESSSETSCQAGHLEKPEPSSSSVDDSSTEATGDETIWTKEMDQIILEGCKLHGPKDKTFSRIAKQIEKVTSKQVQKRFHRLLTLLLESGSEDDAEESF